MKRDVEEQNLGNSTKSKISSKDKNLPPIDFGWLDIRVCKIHDIFYHPWDEDCFIAYVDIGVRLTRLSVIRLVGHYKVRDLIYEMCVGISNINYINKKGPTTSLRTLVAVAPGKRELLQPPFESKAGDLITVEGYTRNLYDPLAALHKFDQPVKPPKRKIFTAVAPDLRVNADKIATYRNIPLNVVGRGPITTRSLSNCRIR